MKKEIAKFWWNHNIIILEWKKENNPYLLTNENKLVSLENKSNWKLIKENDKKISLITFTYYDEDFGSLRFVGDSYYHPEKERHVAILWLTGHAKNALERRLQENLLEDS